MGSGVIVDASPLTITTVEARFQSTTTVRLLYSSGSFGAAAPLTVATGDKVNVPLGYLAA